ncbi:MAG: hypothetical protein KC964_00580, partial [Candidatus Omnitrophica bacterium]|nr:hypothetical protein [Candidatus Omnitrophota bacterium]
YEATIQPDGRIELSEQVQLKGPRRAILTLLNEGDSIETAVLSENALADWNSSEEDQADRTCKGEGSPLRDRTFVLARTFL